MSDDIVTRLGECDHALTRCHECEYWELEMDMTCQDCEGHGYYEYCAKCGEPMVNEQAVSHE